MPEFKGHRTFAAFWDWAVRHESRRERELRSAAAGSVSGRVLELGVGVGANWAFLPPDIEYTAIDPDPHMLERARKRAEEKGEARDLRQAAAEDLPFPDGSFDAVLVTLTLCSVDDPARALAEAWRVLKPGGRLVFFEHVRPGGRVAGRLTDLITPAWRRIGGGCHPNRRTEASIADAGFQIERIQRQRLNGLPMIAGTARKP
jgi:ubiquinone/menaquinone biosynthesis C-methylase UbiE